MSVIAQFRKRNVFRTGAAYLVGAWLIVQVADTLLPAFGFGDTAVRVVVVLLAIGFLPTLILAWAFRLTPEGLRRESEIDAPLSTRAVRRIDRGIMAVLALTLVVLAIDRFVLEARRENARELRVAERIESARAEGRSEAALAPAGIGSIAVLPFANLSDDAANEYFSDGIAEEILNLLARLPDLRVISRSSAFSYKGANRRLGEIAAELDVAHILEGSVRKVGDRVRITAHLIDARNDRQVWSEAFDRRLDDVFAIQQEIANAVADRLQLSLLDEIPRPRVTDPKAYALFLQARFLGHQGSADGYAGAIEFLEQVLSIDPGYPAAWDALAGNVLNQAGKGLRDREDGFRTARHAAERALAIDPRFAPAYTRLGWVAMLGDGDLELAARHYQQALELAPTNIRTIGDAASLLRSLGRAEECVALDEFVVARDPVNAVGHFNLGGSYLYAGRTADAVDAFRTALRLSPNRLGGYYQLGIAQLLSGETDEALTSMQREPLDVLRLLGSAMAHHALGDAASADRLEAELIDQHESDAAYNIAYLMAYRGKTDAAFDWLDKAVQYNDPGLADIVAEPLFSNLYADTRWAAFLESVGKSPEQLQSIRFEVAVPGN